MSGKTVINVVLTFARPILLEFDIMRIKNMFKRVFVVR